MQQQTVVGVIDQYVLRWHFGSQISKPNDFHKHFRQLASHTSVEIVKSFCCCHLGLALREAWVSMLIMLFSTEHAVQHSTPWTRTTFPSLLIQTALIQTSKSITLFKSATPTVALEIQPAKSCSQGTLPMQQGPTQIAVHGQ